jgi:hypothetical protein
MRRTLLAASSGARATPTRPTLRRLLPVAVIGAALSLSACQTQSPIQTDVPYNAADGVPVDLGAVQIRDLVIISEGKDKPGVLSGALINTGGTEQRVAFAAPNSQPVYASAAPHSEARISGASQVQMPSVPVNPGEVLTLTVQSPSAPAAVVVVPVLPPAEYYQTLRPTGAPVATAASPATPSETAAPTTTATP